MTKCGVYAIKNRTNNKMYIGQSVNVRKRKSYHLWLLRTNNHFNPKLQSAFNKYGEENFEFVILEKCNKDELDDKEIKYINRYNTINDGYNICEGGEGSLGRTLSEETKQKISNANTGRKQDEVAKKRKSEIMKELWKTAEYRKKMKQRPKPKPWNKGRRHTEEEKKHLSEKLKGRRITEEHKKKLHELYKGEKSLTAKLTEQQVIEIRLRFLKGEKQCDIKKDYQVSAQTIYDIVRNRRWRHIPNTIKELEKIKEAK
ncbi:MAG TPA: GIY-YIG nuclease family protein [Tissierellia bacterium]|nr:GIY-YIG nuclease family protein [Tissierellia bacterium]